MSVRNSNLPDAPTVSTVAEESPALDLLDRVDELLQSAIQKDGQGYPVLGDDSVHAMPTLIVDLREALVARDATIASITEQSDALARAQADAIVHSAEIIDELERTKQHLADARSSAEQAAHDTQRLADTVFERTNDGVLVFSDRSCVACNDNALQLLSIDRNNIIGTWPDAFGVASFEDGKTASAKLLSTYHNVTEQNPATVEVLLPKRVDEMFWAEVTMSAFSMQDAGHVLMVVRDISARKQFEEELRRHRDFLDNIINAVPDQLSVTATDSTLVLANDAYCTALGVGREQVIGKNATALLPNGARDQLSRIQEQLLLTGSCKTTEHDFNRADGTQAIVSVKHSTFEDNTGKSYIVASSRDITEDRTREDRLRLLASVFNGASEGVAILSPHGQVREANPAFLSMSFVDSLSPVGRPLAEALQFDIGNISDVLSEVANGHSWSGKAHVSGQDHGDQHYWVSLSPSSEDDGKVTRIIALVSDITELEFAQEKLRTQALYDSLTGLPNRLCFRDYLQELLDNEGLREKGITVCFFDLDDFKHVNDSTGHAAGDRLLKAVGEKIQQLMGEDAFVARFGGDEFAMILPACTHQSPQLIDDLEQLIAAFRNPFTLGDTEAVVGLSIGVTSYPEQGTEVGTLMCNADIAMYAAKSAGKNRIRIFTPELQDGVNTRHQVQTKLSRALKGGEITLCFQPKVCAKTRQPVGCEALARWKMPDETFIPPSEFIPIAEQTGLILALGELVFRLAAEQATEWAAAGLSPAIAVNVSPNQLRHTGFVEQLLATLEETGARPEWFELEVTEYAMMDDVGYAIAVIDELASLGFKVAIDDFGTGYSSLSYLKHFRIHTLKIDLSFVRDVTHDWQSGAVVRSIVSLGAGLGLNIVAEGVETAEQAALLSEIGCTALQGYHIGRPMPAEQYQDWLESRPQS